MEHTKNLDDAFKKLEKAFGKNSIMVLGEVEPVKANLISTGSLLIDQALGGGIGVGRITEIYGPESSGKSTLCLHLVAECQKTGGRVAYIDTEQAMDPIYARKLGVNIDDLIFAQPSSAEEALEMVDVLAQTGDIKLIVLDSVAALAPQAELDGEMSDMTIGLQARLMSKFCRKISATLNENKCAVVCINQIRDKVSTGFSMGPSETTTGGRALKFFASQRIELRKTTAIKEGDNVVGANTKVKVVKNKISVPMKSVVLPLIFGKGFNSEDEVIQLALDYGLCTQAGAFYTTHDGNKFQGRIKFKGYYDEHPELAADLRELVKAKLSELDIEQEFEVDEKTGEIIE